MENAILYSILFLLTSPLAGYILYQLTKDEKELIKFYFFPLRWVIAISAAIFYSISLMYALILTYIFLTMVLWLYFLRKKKS